MRHIAIQDVLVDVAPSAKLRWIRKHRTKKQFSSKLPKDMTLTEKQADWYESALKAEVAKLTA